MISRIAIKKSLLHIALTFLISLLLVTGACDENTDQPVNGSMFSVNACTLAVIDSIGCAIGDSNYIFGSVDDVYLGTDGRIYVLDRIQLSVLLYDDSGEFVQRIGRPGSGPGDLDNPGSVISLSNGTICVSDGINGWITFDSSGRSLNTHSLGTNTMSMIFPVDSTDVVGKYTEFRRLDDGRHAREMTLCRWSALDPDSVLNVYYYENYIREGGPDPAQTMQDAANYNLNPPFLFTACDEFVCVAPEPSDEPILLLFNVDGSKRDTLFLPYETVPKTTAEINEEIAYIEGYYNNLLSRYGIQFEWEWEPMPHHSMISSLGVDSLNRIWVQRGFERRITFDLYDLNCDHLMTVVLPDKMKCLSWKTYLNGNGIAAVHQDSISHFVIYRLAFKND